MLVLQRKLGESVVIDLGDSIVTVTVIDINRGKIRLGFNGPREVAINRKEVANKLFRIGGDN